MMKNLLLALLLPLTAFSAPKIRTPDIVNGAITAPKLAPGLGSEGQVLMGSSANASGLKWAGIDGAGFAQNVAAGSTVASNALTLSISGNYGGSFSSSNLGKIPFRRTTASNARYDLISMTADVSVTVPAGATLACKSNEPCKLYLYAINNGGTVEAAVAGSDRFQVTTLQSTTAISTSANDANTLYSTTARTNVPVYLVGEFIFTQTTAGQWAAGPTQAATLDGKQTQAIVSLKTNPIAFTPTFTGAGTATGVSAWYERDGSDLIMWGQLTTGTVTSAAFSIGLPAGLTIDISKIGTFGHATGGWITTNRTNASSATNVAPIVVLPGTSTTAVYISNLADGSNSNNLTALTALSTFGNFVTVAFGGVRIPIKEWAQATTANIFEAGDFAPTPYTPTITGVGTASGVLFTYERKGKNMIVRGEFTTGSTAASLYSISLPAGFTIDAAAYGTPSSGRKVGSQTRSVLDVNNSINILYSSANGSAAVYGTFANVTTKNALSPDVGNQIMGNSERQSLEFTVPITQWSEFPFGVALPVEVSAKFGAVVGTDLSVSGGATIVFPTVFWDSHGAYSSSTGRFTAPLKGHYSLTCSGLYSSTPGPYIHSYKNGSWENVLWQQAVNGGVTPSGVVEFDLNQGDYISLAPDTSVTLRSQNGNFTPRCTVKKIN